MELIEGITLKQYMQKRGILSGYRFVEIGTVADKYGTGMSAEKITSLALVGANIGWNYIVCSLLIVLGTLGFSMLLGYNRNPGGLCAIVIMNVLPAIGFFANFNFFVSYGYGLYAPAMALFGLTYNLTSKGQQCAHNAIFAGIVIGRLSARIRRGISTSGSFPLRKPRNGRIPPPRSRDAGKNGMAGS